jgi:hypothetical protein
MQSRSLPLTDTGIVRRPDATEDNLALSVLVLVLFVSSRPPTLVAGSLVYREMMMAVLSLEE